MTITQLRKPQEFVNILYNTFMQKSKVFDMPFGRVCVYSMIMSQVLGKVLGKENVSVKYSLKLTMFIARLASF